MDAVAAPCIHYFGADPGFISKSRGLRCAPSALDARSRIANGGTMKIPNSVTLANGRESPICSSTMFAAQSFATCGGQASLGHRTRTVFERYNITDQSDTQEASRRTNK